MKNLKYKPDSHADNRMQHEGDVSRARNYFFSEAPLNLKFLLEKRFSWMNISPVQIMVLKLDVALV